MKNKMAVKDFPKVDFKKNKKPLGFLNKKIKIKHRTTFSLTPREVDIVKELSQVYSIYWGEFVSQSAIIRVGINILNSLSPEEVNKLYAQAREKI